MLACPNVQRPASSNLEMSGVLRTDTSVSGGHMAAAVETMLVDRNNGRLPCSSGSNVQLPRLGESGRHGDCVG